MCFFKCEWQWSDAKERAVFFLDASLEGGFGEVSEEERARERERDRERKEEEVDERKTNEKNEKQTKKKKSNPFHRNSRRASRSRAFSFHTRHKETRISRSKIRILVPEERRARRDRHKGLDGIVSRRRSDVGLRKGCRLHARGQLHDGARVAVHEACARGHVFYGERERACLSRERETSFDEKGRKRKEKKKKGGKN